MSFFSHFALYNLSKDDAFQNKAVNDDLIDQLYHSNKQRKVFHIDCQYTKKKVCYCKYSDYEHMPKKEKALYEATVEFLENDFKGKGKEYYKEVYDRKSLLQEKIKHIQEPEDIKYWMNYFEDPITAASRTAAANAAANAESGSPVKKLKTDASTAVNVTPNANPTTNEEERTRGRKSEAILPQRTRSGPRKNMNEDEEDGDSETPMCFFESCGKGHDLEDFLSCTKCKKTFHAKCCQPPLNKSIVDRYPWQCNDCKVCIVCKLNVDENKMIICDICDRAFHSDCLQPKLTDIPKGNWYCHDCKKCKSCGASLAKEPGFPNLEKNLWDHDYFLCTPCLRVFQNKN